MASFFISHSSTDNEAAALVREWLVGQGFSSVFLDFDPAVGIPAGREWEDELYSQLRRADVVLFLATSAAADSKWCHAELVMSRSLGRTIVPVLLEPGATHPLVRDTQWVRLELDGPGSLAPLGEALKRLNIDPLDTFGWDPSMSPYPGLAAYDESRAGVFFGREHEVETVLEPLRRPYGEAGERLVFVVGASGSGKSSLLRAGVLPRLRRLERGWIVLPTFAPEDAPLEQLAHSLANALSGSDWRACHERLLAGEHGLKQLTREISGATGDAGIVISIDQAEQLATQSSPADRLAFLETLAAALSGRTHVRAVATLRSEYLSEIVAGSAFEGSVSPTVSVGRLSRGGLCEVIERPAQRAGIDFENGLVSRMVEDTLAGSDATGDPLPLLAFTLQQIYERRANPTRITFADYDAVGGVFGALKEEANRTYQRLERQGLGEGVLPTLLELAHVERERRPTGRSVKRARLTTASQIVDAFVEARLLTIEGDEGTIHVAHEAIFSEWPLLRDEIARSQQHLIARTQLEEDTRDWERASRDPSYLISGARLESARSAHAADPAPDPSIADFVAASERRSRRQAWRTRSLIGLAGLVALAAVAFGARTLLDRLNEDAAKNEARAPLVSLPGGAALDETQVTNRRYDLCVGRGVCTAAAENEGELAGETEPRVMVDAAQATAFCAWLGRRLPTRAELVAATTTRGVEYWEPPPPATPAGLWEWTSTPKDNGLRNVRLDPDKTTHERTVDRAWRDFDLVFRCAS